MIFILAAAVCFPLSAGAQEAGADEAAAGSEPKAWTFEGILGLNATGTGLVNWTGNPSLTASQSPDGIAKEWPLYDLRDKRVMVLDDNDSHPAREADVHIVDWDRTIFLIKYYML